MDHDPEPKIVRANSNIKVTEEGRLALHQMRVAAYEVTEHQLTIITWASENTGGIHLAFFMTCGSIAITILLALQTTEIKNPSVALWWQGAFIGFAVVTIFFLVMVLQNRSKDKLKAAIAEIRNQKLPPP